MQRRPEADPLVVAHYSAPAPKPAAPRHLRAIHRGATLTATWRRVAGAASYSVVVSTSDGHHTLRIVTRPRPKMPAAASARGTVQVAVERPGTRRRATATARFRPSHRLRRRAS